VIAADAVMNARQFWQSESGLPSMWGSAAWAQTQLTPGVSTLAAPRSSFRTWLKRVSSGIVLWRGNGREPRSAPEQVPTSSDKSSPEQVPTSSDKSFVGLSQRCFICGHELNAGSHGEQHS